MNNACFNKIVFRQLSIIFAITGSLLFSVNVMANDKGKKVFDTTCHMCHIKGVMGAPKFGNKEDWAPRIAKGKETLYQHALHGFKGKKGTMPAKGGNAKLSDADVKAAVDYMLAHAK